VFVRIKAVVATAKVTMRIIVFIDVVAFTPVRENGAFPSEVQLD
jgi:hypothetical protein